MKTWLHNALQFAAGQISEDAAGYCLGRGLPEPILRECQVGTWVAPEIPCPDPEYTRRFGPHGESVADWLSIPVWAPSGKLLGVEYRRWHGEKAVMKHFLPPSKWTPTFYGMTPTTLSHIWDGADVWLVEGVFDLALAHIIPHHAVALACGGAHLSPDQVRFLSRFVRPQASVFVAFDEDATGRGMAEGRRDATGKFHKGARQRLEDVNLRVQVVRYRGGKDPGEIWESGGKPALQAAFVHYLNGRP